MIDAINKKLIGFTLLAGFVLAAVYWISGDNADLAITIMYLVLHFIGSTVWKWGLIGASGIMAYGAYGLYMYSHTLGIMFVVIFGISYGYYTIMKIARHHVQMAA